MEKSTTTPKKRAATQKKDALTPRKKRNLNLDSKGNRALQFFNEKKNEHGVVNGIFICKICNSEKNGSSKSNLAAHLLHKHQDIYIEHIGAVEEPIAVKRLKLLQNCVSIVALGGRPFSSLLDYGFQQIIQHQLNEFAAAGQPLDLKQKHQPIVHTHLIKTADEVRSKIKNSVNERVLSVQMDIASRMGRSIFSIDVQYICDSELKVINIGMIELEKAHTGSYLSQVYRICLDRYGIQKNQIISITADDGKNVRKMIRIEQANVEEEQPNTTNVSRQLDFNESSDMSIDDNIELLLATAEELSPDDVVLNEIFEECDIILNTDSDEQINQTILADTIRELDNHYVFNLTGVNCACHTLQLVVRDAVAALPKATLNVIELCRRIVKLLRLKSTRDFLNNEQIKSKMPRIEVETRWGSMYCMVSCLFCHIYDRKSRRISIFSFIYILSYVYLLSSAM